MVILAPFADSDEIVSGCTSEPSEPEIVAISENLDSIFNSNSYSDAKIAVAVHRCILSARNPFFKDIFSDKEQGVKLKLKNLAKDFNVSFDALVTVLVYLYSGRVRSLRLEGVCVCVDDECDHVACRPAVDFLAEVLYASFVFAIAELVALYQSNNGSIDCNPSHIMGDVELGKRFFPRCLEVVNKMMDDDDWSELAPMQNETQEDRQLKKRRYLELQEVITKAFQEDKEEFISLSTYLLHRTYP
ncbi:hypothetical protein Vadar_031961 [Vaccinium darrowii]|uniref:Uncharacterized protein n=1 Tax=Vaccinium darrowii TaxID=229202 RepID=A0ACB7YJJ7_9ERIC|nr:hypothetical protein Vadar_031961 [Vaccinium darrowii]